MTPPNVAPVLEGVSMEGRPNTPDEVYLANIQHAMRLGHPQVKGHPLRPDRVCLVGGGPSLTSTVPELLELVRDGAKLVTMNGSYKWALDHNLTPSAFVMLDARQWNARFLDPGPIPRCQYLISSTCHPDVWARVADWPNVWVFHPVTRASEDCAYAVPSLDDYYLTQWVGIAGGSTVGSRALFLLRLLGYLRFDLFGIDSCWMDREHHAFAQPENDQDTLYWVRVHPRTPHERVFRCSGWHLKQLEDWLQIIRVNGSQFLLNVHGDGLLAYVMRTMAEADDLDIAPAEKGDGAATGA